MKRALGLALAVVLACPAQAAQTAQVPPSLQDFDDAIQHWRNGHDRDYPRYAPEQVAAIADNLLRYQRSDGGWPVNQDPARILDAAERRQLQAEQTRAGGSFDNRNIYTQVEYLAAAYAQTSDTRYRDASRRGLEFILAQQIASCGGWPHTVPATESYHPRITFADDVTAGVLTTLRKAALEQGDFAFVDARLRRRTEAAIVRGDACILRLQVRQGDARTGWAGQHDPQTLRPAPGRKFELPALVVQESVGVVRYLMRIPEPSPEVIAAVGGAVAWLRRAQLRGQRLETFAAPAEQYRYHRSDSDRRLVADPHAPPLWARFYDLDDNSVVLATRDGARVADYTQIPRERRTGYQWYGDWPRKLLEHEYPRWHRSHRRVGLGPPSRHSEHRRNSGESCTSTQGSRRLAGSRWWAEAHPAEAPPEAIANGGMAMAGQGPLYGLRQRALLRSCGRGFSPDTLSSGLKPLPQDQGLVAEEAWQWWAQKACPPYRDSTSTTLDTTRR